MPNPIIPGPLEEGCHPKPKEIVCIETFKVYDFCFQTDSLENSCFPLPAACSPPVPTDVTIQCSVTRVTTQVLSVTPLPSPPAPPGFARVSILLTIFLSFKILNPDGTTRCTFDTSTSFVKSVALCAPPGTDVVAEVAASRCGPCFITGGTQVCCEIDLCLLIQSKALVKLLVPSFGFCEPAECVELPKLPLPCPPTPLFPPQCVPPKSSCC